MRTADPLTRSTPSYAATRLFDWRSPAAAGGPHDPDEPATAAIEPTAASDLAARLGVARELIWLAAAVRVVGMLAGETEVTIGYRRRPAAALAAHHELDDRQTWRDLVVGVGAGLEAGDVEHAGFDVVVSDLVDGDAMGGVDAAVIVEVGGDRTEVRCDPQRFDADFAGRFAGYLASAIEAMAVDLDQPYGQVDLLSPTEREHLLTGRSGPARALPDERWHALFAAQARLRPDATAVVHQGQSWSYGWLDQASNQVAHALLAASLRGEEVVGVSIERGPQWAAALIGVLKAGGVYLPVEPSYPQARVAALLDGAQCRVVVAGPTAAGRAAAELGAGVLDIDQVLTAGHPSQAPATRVTADQLAYVYFTSGSTGTPKGAMCEHAGMLNHLVAKVDDFGIGPGDVVVQATTAAFDISLWQLAAPLMVGATSLIVSDADVRDVPTFLDIVIGSSASILQVVPSYLDILLRHLEANPRELGRLRNVCVTGEAISTHLVQRFFAAHPQILLTNAYGATEASDDTNHEIMARPPAEHPVPVGRPLNNVTIYVLGPGSSLAPLGAPGEIAFAGVCVGRGYINDPERTAAAFSVDPFRPGQRLYRTGDYGRWLPSGSLEFHGRRDEQVKVNGIRLELGEIESQLLAHPDVMSASVVVTQLAGVGKGLIGFYTGDAALDPDRLREHLVSVLPATAMPARLMRLDALPLTSNGKVNKRRLDELAQQSARVASPQRVGARTPTEQRIANAWAQALDRPVSEIGADDVFFDIGGGSLSALRVVANLHGLVSLEDLMRNPVLSALARRADEAAGTDGQLLRLLSGPATGAREAVVCLPDASGTAVSFHSFGRSVAALDPQVAVYALAPPGHDPGRPDEPLMGAQRLVELVRGEVAALGLPVALWGHGSGSALAVELARAPGSAVGRVFIAGQLLSSAAELNRQTAMVVAASDDQLVAELSDRGGLDGVTERELTAAMRSLVARCYRHDIRVANQLLGSLTSSEAGSAGSAMPCPVTVVVSTTDPLTAQYQQLVDAWRVAAGEVGLAEIDGGGHYFIRTRPEQAAAVVAQALGWPGT